MNAVLYICIVCIDYISNLLFLVMLFTSLFIYACDMLCNDNTNNKIMFSESNPILYKINILYIDVNIVGFDSERIHLPISENKHVKSLDLFMCMLKLT